MRVFASEEETSDCLTLSLDANSPYITVPYDQTELTQWGIRNFTVERRSKGTNFGTLHL